MFSDFGERGAFRVAVAFAFVVAAAALAGASLRSQRKKDVSRTALRSAGVFVKRETSKATERG